MGRRPLPPSKFSVFSPTQRLSAPSCRPHAPHPCSWHRWVFERAWPRPPRGRASSARRLGPTQGHAPCPKPPETRAAGTTWYLPRREHAPHASGARKARKQRTDADMKPPMTSGRIKDLKKISDPWPNPATVKNGVQVPSALIHARLHTCWPPMTVHLALRGQQDTYYVTACTYYVRAVHELRVKATVYH